MLWDVYGDNQNYNVLTGHRNAVLEVKWSKLQPQQIVSCSADKTLVIWDANKGVSVRKLAEHKGIVNSCALAMESSNIIASGSDDNTAMLWDTRNKKKTGVLPHAYQVTAVCMNSNGEAVYTGGLDNTIV